MAGEGTPIGALAVRIGADATELIEAMKKGSNAVQSLEKNVSGAISTFRKFAVALEVSAMAAWVKNAADMADQAGKVAQKVGMTVEAFSSLKYAAGVADVGVDQLKIGLQQLSKNMQEANQGAGDAFSAFKALGIEVSDRVGGQLKSTEETLLKVAEKFAAMEDGAGKTTIAMRIFGRSGADLIPFLNQGRDGIEALRKEAERLGIVISSEAAKRAEEFNDNLTKLKASSDALAISLTSDLVKALGDAAGAMLKLKMEGAGLFDQWSKFLATLFTGDDVHRWNVQMSDAIETLDVAERRLIAAKSAAMSDNGKMFPEQAAAAVAKYSEEVRKARDEVERLQRIKKTLLGDKGEEPPPPPKKSEAPILETDQQRKERLDAELKAEEMFQQDLREAKEAETNFLVSERQKQLDTDKQMLEAKFKAIDDEQQREIDTAEETGAALGLSQSAKLADLANYLDNGLAVENDAYAKRLEALKNFSDEELATIGGRQAAEKRLEEDHLASVDAIRRADLMRKRAQRQGDLDDAEMFFGAMEGLMNTSSRKLFEIGKAGAIANTIVKTYSAAMNAWEQLSAIGPYGWIAGAAAAAAIIAAGVANVSKIASTQFGSRSMAGGTFAVSPNTGQPSVESQVGQREQPKTVILNVKGETFSRDALIQTVDSLNKESKSGIRLVVDAT